MATGCTSLGGGIKQIMDSGRVSGTWGLPCLWMKRFQTLTLCRFGHLSQHQAVSDLSSWLQTFWNSWLSILSMTPNFLFLFFNVIFGHRLRIHPRSNNESNTKQEDEYFDIHYWWNELHLNPLNCSNVFVSRLFFALVFNLVLFAITIVFTEVTFLPLKKLDFHRPAGVHSWPLPSRWTLMGGKVASTGSASSLPASSTWTTQSSRSHVMSCLNKFPPQGI